MPAHLYDQEMRCARVTEEERALITSRLMSSLKNVHVSSYDLKKIIACDPSEGGDEIVIKYFENTEVLDKQIMHKVDIGDNLMILSGHIKNMSMKHKCKNFIIDGVGVGSGVADDLALNKEFNVIKFKGGKSASEPERFADKNMEATFYVSREMRIGNVEPIKDTETRRQLTFASRFQVNNKGQMRLDAANIIKKDCECSPDRAKAYIMGIYGLQFVKPESQIGTTYRRKRRKKRSAMAA
jgi:hypothetical protein